MPQRPDTWTDALFIYPLDFIHGMVSIFFFNGVTVKTENTLQGWAIKMLLFRSHQFPAVFSKMPCYIYSGRHHLRTMPRAICQANFIRSAGSNESQSSSHSSSVISVEASPDGLAAENKTIGISILHSPFSPASAWSFSCKKVEGWLFSSNAFVFFPSASASYKKSFTN